MRNDRSAKPFLSLPAWFWPMLAVVVVLAITCPKLSAYWQRVHEARVAETKVAYCLQKICVAQEVARQSCKFDADEDKRGEYLDLDQLLGGREQEFGCKKSEGYWTCEGYRLHLFFFEHRDENGQLTNLRELMMTEVDARELFWRVYATSPNDDTLLARLPLYVDCGSNKRVYKADVSGLISWDGYRDMERISDSRNWTKREMPDQE